MSEKSKNITDIGVQQDETDQTEIIHELQITLENLKSGFDARYAQLKV